jgi:diguanylate cyclase (GGDEF)-like protein
MATHDLEVLNRLPLFRGVDLWRIRPLLERCPERRLVAGEVLVEPRVTNRQAFVVLDGEFTVHIDQRDAPPIATLGRGETLGELSLFGGHLPTAFVVAAQPSKVLVIDEDLFWDLINASHDVAINLLYVLAGRVRSGNSAIGASEQRANHDALTGLHNRRWLDDTFKRESARAHAENLPLCIAMVDVDKFKRFNDEHGHQAGDAVLRAVGATLKHNARPTDLVARYGGEEFAVLLLGASIEVAVAACDRLREAIAATEVKGPDGAVLPRVTASFGVARLAPGETLDALVARADEALYRAKEGGRNCVRE